MALSLLSSLKKGAKFTPQGRIISPIYKTAKKLALGSGAVFGIVMLTAIQLGGAVLKGAIAGASIGGSVGLVGGGVIGFQIGVALAPFTFGLSIPVFTVLGATTGAFVGATIGAIAGGAIAYGLSTGSFTAISTGVGAGVGGTIGVYVGYVGGAALGGALVAGCAALFAPCAALAPVVVPVSGAIGAVVGGYVGTVIGGAIGYGFGRYVAEPVKNFFSGSQVRIRHAGELTATGTGNLITGTWNAIKGGIGGFGHSAVGWASAGWNTAFGFGGSLLGGLASGVSSLVSGLGWSYGALAGTIAKVGVFTTAGASLTFGVLTGLSGAAALSDPKGEYVSPPAGDNEFFTLTKTADKTSLQNSDLPTNITFSVSLTAKAKKLTAISLNDQITVTQLSKTFNPLPTSNTCSTPPAEIQPNTAFTCQVVISATGPPSLEIYWDSVVSNTITASATPEAGTPLTDTATTTVVIGQAPANCPTGWPTTHGTITQDPQGSTSHARLALNGEEAIDIAGAGASRNSPAYATFVGTVLDAHNQDDQGYGRYVDITGVCNGKQFRARYAHLVSINSAMIEGRPISLGQEVGKIDATGNVVCEPQPDCDASHLHYSFWELEMTTPHIPQEPIVGTTW